MKWAVSKNQSKSDGPTSEEAIDYANKAGYYDFNAPIPEEWDTIGTGMGDTVVCYTVEDQRDAREGERRLTDESDRVMPFKRSC